MTTESRGGGAVRRFGERDRSRTRAREGVIAILRTGEFLRHRFHSVLEPYGVTPSQYHVLRILEDAGGRIATLTLAARLIERTPGITRMLGRLEAKGLVKRERAARDRRRVLCGLTAKGSRLLKRLDAPIEEAEVRSLEALDPPDQERLIRLLEILREAHDPEHPHDRPPTTDGR